MNRKQRRAQAKLNRKSGYPSLAPLAADRELLGFGAYYKGDTDHGMGTSFTTFGQGFTSEALAVMYNSAVEGSNEVLKYYYQSGQLAILLADFWSNLEEAVANFNMAVYGTPTQPQKGFHAKVEIGPEILEAFLDCAVWIGVLAALGEIQDDNQNGWHTMQTVREQPCEQMA